MSDLGDREVDVDLRAGIDLLEGDRRLHFEVLAGCRRTRRAPTTTPLPATERGEEIGQIDVLELLPTAAESAIRKILLPALRRLEVLAGSMVTELVVRRTLFRILQRGIGLGHFLEPGLAIRIARDIRVVLVRELAVGLLDVRGLGVARDTEDLVVILELHVAFTTSVRHHIVTVLCSPRSSGGLPVIAARAIL